MTFKHLAGVPTLLCALCATTSAFAQDPPPASAPPPAAAPMPPAAGAPAPAQEEKARFRWGISGFYGRYMFSGQSGGLGGLDLRFGAQLNNNLGIYGSPVFMVGAAASAGANGASLSALALYGVGALADYTVDDMFFFAGGPELLAGGGGAETVTDTSGNATAEAGTFLGLEARAGVALGSVHPDRRQAFTIGINFHAVFMNKTTLIPVLALGYDSF